MALVLLVPTYACQQHVDNVAQLAAWVRDPTNGLVDSVCVTGMTFKMQYLPVGYLIEIQAYASRFVKRTKDQVRAPAGDSLAVFELTILSEGTGDVDPAFIGLESMDGFTARMRALAFTLQDDVVLYTDGNAHACVSAQLQQDIGLRADRSVRLVFYACEEDLLKATETVIEFSDTQYGTGKHSFRCKLAGVGKMPVVDHRS